MIIFVGKASLIVIDASPPFHLLHVEAKSLAEHQTYGPSHTFGSPMRKCRIDLTNLQVKILYTIFLEIQEYKY